MKLYLAISGESQDDVMNKLHTLVLTDVLIEESNATAEVPDGNGGSYHVDYQWDDEDGDAMLADLVEEM